MAYSSTIIGRKHEQDILSSCIESNRAEFIAVYGRRRIGKTFLVKQFFGNTFDFYATGVYKISRQEQLRLWQEQLAKYSGEKCTKPKDWFEAFDQLRMYLETLKGKDKLILFIDELPWLDTPKSGFIRALDLFWNGWAAERRGLKLVVCGSATTWMTNKLLADKGGLHNRVTRPIRLAPFTLKETEEYLQSINIAWERKDVLDTYMILGGTPFYLSLLRQELTLWQNIDELFFSRDAVLKAEYNFLFSSLVREATLYRRIVELLATKIMGMTRSELLEQLKIIDSGKLSIALDNLVKCDFLRCYQAFGMKNRNMLYQLSDMYTLFYLRFVKNYHGMNEHAWSNMEEGKRNVWAGYAFEQVCILHINQIRSALGISGIANDVCSWYYRNKEQSAQIDLIIDRSDKAIDLCEMKYSDNEYELKKDYVEWLRRRRDLFREVSGTKKTLRLTMIASAGIKQNMYASALQGKLSMEDLFL